MIQKRMHCLGLVIAVLVLAAAACAPTAPPPAPTKPAAAASTAPAAKPAEPTKVTAAPQPTAAPLKKAGFPEKGKTITLIVPYTPGGSVDLAGRLLAGTLEKELGTSVQVLNKPGAGTQTGATELANSKPDGYTLILNPLAPLIVTYLDAERKAAYARKDFQVVAMYTADTVMMAVKADSPFRSVRDLVDAAKASSERLRVGATGLMTLTHLAGLMVQQSAGVRFAFVQFDGAAPAMTALLGGHVDAVFSSSGGILPHFTSGSARVLGIMGTEERNQFPGVKTFEAQGYKVYAPAAHAVIAPGGTPAETVATLSKTVKKVTDSSDVAAKLEAVGLAPRYMDTAEAEADWTEWEQWVQSMMKLAKE